VRPQHSPRYPYTFTNFVWWSDAELRAELTRRIPGLPLELAPDSTYESRIRTALESLLKQKGISASVQSIEPALHVYSMGRDPNAPPDSIQFSILAPPEVVIENLVIENGPAEAMELLGEEARQLKGRPYTTTGFWLIQEHIIEGLQQAGYLTAAVELRPDQPKLDGARYAVKVIAGVTSGPKFHVAKVDADGGPLLTGRDLSSYFSLKPGDVAAPDAFGKLIGGLRSTYWRAGYADVAFDGAPALDVAHGLASYHLKVIPGPIYHLRSIKMEGLTAAQEAEARHSIALMPGDIYDGLAISRLSADSSQAGPSLNGYRCSFSPRKDKQAHVIDLTLTFYKQ
jgi:outer membrane protein assembly factor BamA